MPSILHLLSWLLILAAPSLLLLLARRRRRTMRSKLPPGPRPLPLIGNLHELGAQPHHSLHRLALEHGPLMYLKLGSVPTVVMSSSEVVQEAFKAHDLVLSSRPGLYAGSRFTYGNLDVAFAPYGDYWRQARKLCVQELLNVKRVQSFRSIREQEVASLVAAIADRCSASATTNLSEMILTLINDVVCRAAFGGSGGLVRFRELIEEAEEMLGGFSLADFFPWMGWIHRLDGLEARLEKVFRGLDEHFDQLIDEHVENEGKDSIDGHGGGGEDMIQILLRLQKDPISGKTFSTRNHIKAIIADIFMAGTDTSYTAIIWTMSELMRNPNVMKAAQNEVRKIAVQEGKLVQESDIQSFKYIKSVVKEAMRLHPPAPLLVPRETTDDLTINGYEIPKKTRIMINARTIGLDERRWADAGEFKPERFGGDVEFRGQDYDLIPFGVGRRICPGLNFATAIVEMAMANLLYKYDWELQPGIEFSTLDMEEVFGLTVHRKTPLILLAKPYIA